MSQETKHSRVDKDLSQKIQAIIDKGVNMTVLEKNILALSFYSPQLAKKLLEINTNTKFDVLISQDKLDINLVEKQSKKKLFENPIKETEQKITEFEKDYERYRALFFYGLGNGIFYRTILLNQTHEKIFVFEPEIEIIYIVLNLIDFSFELKNERFVILQSDVMGSEHYWRICQHPTVFLHSKLYNLNVFNEFYDSYEEDMLKINDNLINSIRLSLIHKGNDVNDTLLGIAHHTSNIKNMVENYSFLNLCKTRAKKTKFGIIVSTGPSLVKQLPILKKVAPYASLFCIDASYPILKKHKIKPDYVFSLERVAPTAKFYKDKASEFDENILFVVSSLVHPETVANLKDRKTCFAMRPIIYELGFKDKFHGYIGAGNSAAHLAFETASMLKCEKIVLIGQDLAFGNDGKSHAKGHIYNENEIDPNRAALLEVEAYGGQGMVATTPVWKTFKDIFEITIPTVKNAYGIITYNATEGGARIGGAIEIPFAKIAQEILKEPKKRLPKLKFDSQKIQDLCLKRAKSHIKEILVYGKKLQARIEKLFLRVAKEIEKDKALIANNKADKINYDKLQKLANAVDKIKDEIGTQKFADTFLSTCNHFLVTEDLELAKISLRPSNTQKEKQDKLFEWVSVHGYWLFGLAGHIDAHMNTIKNNATWCDDFKDY
nr:motility associated factor glycosyltransferase family protein [Campylobacter sp.]